MRKTNSFVLLWQAIKSSRRATWALLQVLIAITVVLAAVFYDAENTAQPNEYSFWRSLVWIFLFYSLLIRVRYYLLIVHKNQNSF